MSHLWISHPFVLQEIEKFRQKLKTVQADHSKLQTAYEEKVSCCNDIMFVCVLGLFFIWVLLIPQVVLKNRTTILAKTVVTLRYFIIETKAIQFHPLALVLHYFTRTCLIYHLFDVRFDHPFRIAPLCSKSLFLQIWPSIQKINKSLSALAKYIQLLSLITVESLVSQELERNLPCCHISWIWLAGWHESHRS